MSATNPELESYTDFRQRGGLADLSGRVILRLTGADRVRYLNGQVTANVSRAATGQALPACVTTAKGRLSAEVWIHVVGEALIADADASLRDTLPPRIERYIIADDVQLEDLTDECRIIHVLGDAPNLGELAELVQWLDQARRFGQDGWDIGLRPENFEAVWKHLAEHYAVLPPAVLETLRIEAGIPRWGFELGEDTLPPEAGLDLTHIDYHKGCYIGQEVISRLKSVGHVNRVLTGFVSSGGEPLAAGMQLLEPGGSDRPLGSLTSVAFSFALERPIALGYLKRGTALPELMARSADATTEVRVVPFAFPLAS